MKNVSVVLLLVLTACSAPKRKSYDQSEFDRLSRLQRGLVFTERDEHGSEHPISAMPGANGVPASPGVVVPGKSAPQVARLADGATIDVNSQIDLRTVDALQPPTASGVVPAGETHTLTKSVAEMAVAIHGLADLRAQEQQAVRDWNELESARGSQADAALRAAFDRSKHAAASTEQRALNVLRTLWPIKDPDRPKIEGILERAFPEVMKLQDGTLDRGAIDAAEAARAEQELIVEVQKKLDALSGSLREFEARTRERAEDAGQRLRIEAFLIPSDDGAKAHPVHVPGYDRLDEGEIQRIDPLGLRLTAEERTRLEELIKASDELAKALERVRRGEAKLTEVFEQLSGRLFADLDRLADDLSKLDPSTFAAQKQELERAVDDFVEAARAHLSSVGEDLRTKWKSELDQLIDRSPEIQQLVTTIETIRELRNRWDGVDVAALPKLLNDTLAAVSQLVTAVQKLPTLANDLQSHLDAWRELVAALPASTRTAVWDDSALRKLVEEWRDRARRIHDVVANAVALIKGVRAPVRTTLRNTETIDVPLGEAKDTLIDLRRTTRKAGDHLHVRARLLDGKEGEEDAEPVLDTTFDLEKLGWHADLVPSVVFVEGDRVAGANDSGGFSTALSWVWRYGARDDEDDPHLARSLGWSAGLHAVFLNFGPDNDAEIGLGVTVGLWDQRVQLGAGYNPMADSDDDGRIYYFLGSSLVPLLQALSRDD